MTRPKYTTPDDNQSEIENELTDLGYVWIDVHDLPGNSRTPAENPLDVFVMHPDLLTWVQVEIKTPSGRRLFTPNEQRYFTHLGIWDAVESGMLEPAAQWRQHGVPIVVAWEARQIVELFDEMAQCANRARLVGLAAADSVACAAKGGT